MNSVVVLKLGGELCSFDCLIKVSQTITTLKREGKQCVVVHGGGPQIDELLFRLQVPKRVVAGRRVTDEETLQAAAMVLGGSVNTTVVASLQANGVNAVGLTCVDGGMIQVRKRPPMEVTLPDGEKRAVDYENVGEILSVQPAFLTLLLESGHTPVVASLGADEKGRILNMNADTVACEIAAAMDAQLLVLLTQIGGVLRDKRDVSTVIPTLTTTDIEELKAGGVIAEGMLPKVSAALRALHRGVQQVRICSVEGCVIEGKGTEIVESKAL